MKTANKLAKRINTMKETSKDVMELNMDPDLMEQEEMEMYSKFYNESMNLLDEYGEYICQQGEMLDTINEKLQTISNQMNKILEKSGES